MTKCWMYRLLLSVLLCNYSYVLYAEAGQNQAEPIANVVLDGKLITRDARQVYTSSGEHQPRVYELTESRSTSISYFSIDGQPKPVEQDSNEDLPDKARGEYDRMYLTPMDNGNLLLKTDFRAAFDNGTSSRIIIEAEAEFLEGDLQAFKNGERVVVKYSASGLENLKKQSAQQINDSMMPLLKDAAYSLLQRKVEGFAFDSKVESTVDVVQMTNNPVVIENNSIIVNEPGDSVIRFAVIARAYAKAMD